MWLESIRPDVRQYTHKQYIGHVENHLKPYYGIIPVTRINYGSVEGFIQDCRKKDISLSTLRKIKTTFGAIMSYACHKRYIDHNPVKDIKPPKGQGAHKENEEIAVLAPDQILTLFDAAPDLKHRTLFMTAVMTGMREGETLGLKWDDIDWVAGQVHVKRTYNHGRFYKPKSKTSKRKIDLAPQLITQLKEWQLASPPNELDLVFPTKKRKPMDGASMLKTRFLPALRKAKIPRIRFHDLRHTYASLLIDQGENPKYIQKQMGHSSINVTFDIYGHLMKDANEEAARKLGNTIFGEEKKANGSKTVAEG